MMSSVSVEVCEYKWMQLDDELLARKLQEEEAASLRKRTRNPRNPPKVPKLPVCHVIAVSTLSSYLVVYASLQ